MLDSLYNVSVIYNGSDMEIFLNGELDAFVPWSGAIRQTTFDLTIGQVLPNDNNNNFNGVLDDVRLFDYGLSVDEIAAFSSRLTSVNNNTPITVPTTMALDVYPNPFNPSTVIRMSLSSSGHVTVKSLTCWEEKSQNLLMNFYQAVLLNGDGMQKKPPAVFIFAL